MAYCVDFLCVCLKARFYFATSLINCQNLSIPYVLWMALPIAETHKEGMLGIWERDAMV